MSVTTIIIYPKYCSTDLYSGPRFRQEPFFRTLSRGKIQPLKSLWSSGFHRNCGITDTAECQQERRSYKNVTKFTRFGCGSEVHIKEIFERKYCIAKTNFCHILQSCFLGSQVGLCSNDFVLCSDFVLWMMFM